MEKQDKNVITVHFLEKNLKLIQEKLRISCIRKYARNQINPDKVDISKTDEFLLHNKISNYYGLDSYLIIDPRDMSLLYNDEPIKIHCFYWSPMFSDQNITIYVYADTREGAEKFLVERFRQTYIDSQLRIVNSKECPVCKVSIQDHYFNSDSNGRPSLFKYGIGKEPCFILTKRSD